MQKQSVKINILKEYSDLQVDPSDYDNVIFVESGGRLHNVAQIVLSGMYNKTYTVITDFVPMHDDLVLVDGDRLFICAYDEIAVVDLKRDAVIKVIHYADYQQFGIYKFKNGYFVYGELFNLFLNSSLDLVWECGCIDIFVNPKVKDELEIYDDYIAVYDWYGYRHFYNETGEFKTESHPEYSMNQD